MSDSDEDVYTTPQQSPRQVSRVPATLGTTGGAVRSRTPVAVQSFLEVTLWKWASQAFDDDAHSVFHSGCEQLKCSSRMSKQTRRHSMPALPLNLTKSNLERNDSAVASPGPSRSRQRARSFSTPSILALSGTVEEITGHTAQALAEIAVASFQAGVSRNSTFSKTLQQSADTDHASVDRGLRDVSRRLTIETGLPSLRMSPWAPAKQQQDVTRQCLGATQPGSLSASQSTWNDPQEMNTTELLVTVDRRLSPGKYLDPIHGQRAFAAQQRTRYRREHRLSQQPKSHQHMQHVPLLSSPWYEGDVRASHSQSRLSFPASRHSTASMTDYHTPFLQNTQGACSQTQCASPQQHSQKRHERWSWIRSDTRSSPRRTHHDQYPHQHSQETALSLTPAPFSFSSSRGSALTVPRHASQESLVPISRQPRPRLEQLGSTFDTERDTARRAQWMTDLTRDQQGSAVGKQQADEHYAQHVEVHQEVKRLRAELRDQREADRRANDEEQRKQGLEAFYRAYFDNLRGGNTF